MGNFSSEGSAWPLEGIELLPLIEFSLQIDVTLVAEQFVKFLLGELMSSLNLATESRCAWLDVCMADAEIFDVPVEFGLELMTISHADFADAEWELVDDVINEADRVGLVNCLRK